MFSHHNRPGLAFLIAIGFTTAACCASALAIEMPKRKSGLWEITSSREGKPMGMAPIQHCIDHQSDDLMQQRGQQAQQECSAMDIKQQGATFTVHTVCKRAATTTTLDAVFTGAFDSAYRGDIHTRFDPPLFGMSESKMTLEAKWLGPCKPDQKPGDIVMPGKGTMNLEEAMKKKK